MSDLEKFLRAKFNTGSPWTDEPKPIHKPRQDRSNRPSRSKRKSPAAKPINISIGQCSSVFTWARDLGEKYLKE